MISKSKSIWNVHYDNDGDPYYHNTITNETIRDIPETYDGPQPLIWKKHYDDDGDVYYHNRITNETTRDIPIDYDGPK